MLGLTACAMASAAGYTVAACDVSDSRLSQASRFGASHAVKPPELVGLVRSLTGGRGADLSLELSGSPEAAKLSLEALRLGGQAAWVGAVSPVGTIPVEPESVVRRCLTLTGVHNYTPRDLVAAVEFLAAHHARFPFTELVGRTFPLGEVNEAFRYAENERPVRVAVLCR
jgi:alcohol dehydrogenase